MSFQIHALPGNDFEHLFSMSDAALKEVRACRRTVRENPGTPCRVSLTDAPVGENVILTHHVHHESESPFCASHAIFIRPGAEAATPQPNEVPDMIGSRLLSVRGFDDTGFMLDADVVDGARFDELAHRLFDNADIEYLHIHTAKLGCYLAKAVRS